MYVVLADRLAHEQPIDLFEGFGVVNHQRPAVLPDGDRRVFAVADEFGMGGGLGLYAEGRWEYAISAMRQLALDILIEVCTGGRRRGLS